MFEAQIERGAAWLDKTRPGWERSIDFATLDLAKNCRCVLGQVFKQDALAANCTQIEGYDENEDPIYDGDGYNYAYQLIEDDDLEGDGETVYDWPSRHGFTVEAFPGDGLNIDAAFRNLDEEWIDFIKGRFDRGELSDEKV